MIPSIILAAGASSRMGTPKALLDYRGETFLGRLIRVLGAVTDPVIVVLGYHAAEIQAKIQSNTRANAAGPACYVVNPRPERGQLSSLQTGLAALLPGAEARTGPARPSKLSETREDPAGPGSVVRASSSKGFAFIPMDCPAVREETVALLAREFTARDPESLFVIPRSNGHRGHPVFAAPSIADELLALPADGKASDVVHRHVPKTQYIDVDDPGILTDIDDREAYRKLLETLA